MDMSFSGEAKIRYGPADFTIVSPGAYVVCAVTGERIRVENLRYWNHERQEAYKDAAASLEGFIRAGP
ncbi:MAG: DUF2093 domain-containing protein [Hyphomonadaceae bacterium]|nr:DUF2093 domain-containing protein [Hyphomonadaceae bacterium]MBC6412658.1 DUF2093 domain-containing protein [Hyphomonadaceae bacterium]